MKSLNNFKQKCAKYSPGYVQKYVQDGIQEMCVNGAMAGKQLAQS